MLDSKRMRSRTRLILIAAFVLGSCLSEMSTAQAGEVIYKLIEPNGEIAYSWRPDPGALQIEAIEVNTLTPEQRRAVKQYRQQDIMAERDANTYAARVEDQWTRADNEIKHAQAELQKAEAALQAGRTPLPGERRGNKGGGSRLTQAYFHRLHDLELDLERAKRRLDKGYDARNALK